MPYDRASHLQLSQILWVLSHFLCTALPYVDAGSEQVRNTTGFIEAIDVLCKSEGTASPGYGMQNRCATGCWWGPNAVGGDSLIIAARSDYR